MVLAASRTSSNAGFQPRFQNLSELQHCYLRCRPQFRNSGIVLGTRRLNLIFLCNYESQKLIRHLVKRVELLMISEVNNGGNYQFFWNSSRRFTPIIVDSLRRIECERTAGLTQKAIAALGLRKLSLTAITEEIQRENPERNARLEALSKDDAFLFRQPVLATQCSRFRRNAPAQAAEYGKVAMCPDVFQDFLR